MFDSVAKRKKKANELKFGLFHQNLNDCGWLLQINGSGEVGGLTVGVALGRLHEMLLKRVE